MDESATTGAAAQAELDRLMLLAIHDLRAPLRQSLLHAQLLERSTAGNLDASSEAHLLSVLAANLLANHFLTRLADYCHAGSGLSSSPPASLELVLQNAIRTVGVDPDCDLVLADVPKCSVPAAVQTVIVEFLDNARKFRRGPVTVRVEARSTGNECIFEIRDNGIGFDAPYRETIWEPLQRLHGVGEYPGFGLGLAISRRIICGINGKTWATSVPGEGSSFFFSLPSV